MFYSWFYDLLMIDEFRFRMNRYNKTTEDIRTYYRDQAEDNWDKHFDQCLWPSINYWENSIQENVPKGGKCEFQN